MILAAAPQLLDHPIGDFINEFPWGFFLVVHVALFALGAFFAYRSFDAGVNVLGSGFALFAIAEAVYATYHVNITLFLFAHTIAEVLDGLAFVLVFATAARHAIVRPSPARSAAKRTGLATR
ncbi:MAG TPA: hypothetical protein VF230_10175 [Acidimicrobiales bacterium]